MRPAPVSRSSILAAALLCTPLELGAAAADPSVRLPLPPRILVAPWGESKALDGSPVIVDDHTLAVFSANQISLGFDEVALDFEHNTVFKTTVEDKKGKEPRKVAGYGPLSVEQGMGVWLTMSSWTPEGSDHYSGRHYRDISPTVIRDKDGRVLAIHSVALTRAGQIPGLHAFSADSHLTASIKALSAALNIEEDTTPTTMDYKTALLEKLGLPADATDEQITAALSKAPEAKPEGPEVTALSALDERIKLIEIGADDTKRQGIISAATSAGKVFPLSAEALGKLPVSTVQEIADGLKAGVAPMSAATTTKEGETITALSADEASVAKAMGYTPEQWRELNAAEAV